MSLRKCPSCRDLLIHPRGDTVYCEECGWPNEDFNEKYRYPAVDENLCGLKGLEFFDGKRWVKSGLCSDGLCRCSDSFFGLYRMPLVRAPKKRNKERCPSTNK